MADTKKVTIEIIGGESQSTATSVMNVENKTEITNVTHNITQKTNPLGMVLANQAYEQAKSLVKSAATYYVNRHLALKENYMAEQQVQNIMTAINKGVGFATAVGGGMALGGLPGAVIATAGWVANETLSQVKRYDTAYRELNTNNINLAFARTRAGLSGESGTEN